MCSIIAYKGGRTAAPILVKGLRRMEYRGYDSVGVATISDSSTKKKQLLVRKGVGKVEEVNRRLELDMMHGNVGIGHTRWATHGGVVDKNAHPHSNCSRNIAVVHNGIIDNYQELKKYLISRNHTFRSETDTEVIAHLLEESLAKNDDIRKAMVSVTKKLKGAYAFVAVFEDGRLAGTRYDEPLIVGVGDDDYYISSDVLGFIHDTDRAIFLDNLDIVIVDNKKNLAIYDRVGSRRRKQVTQIAWELADAEKGKFAHYTLKEIDEQRRTISRAFSGQEDELEEAVRLLGGAKKVLLTGSGSSYHAALIAKQLFSKFCKLRCETVISSEFQYELGLLEENGDTVLLAISQSGETADVLSAVKLARASRSKIISFVNVPSSSLARESDVFLSLNCGPEIGVAATKSFTAQLALIYRIAQKLSGRDLSINVKEVERAVDSILDSSKNIEKIAERIKEVGNVYLLGRGVHFPVALEAALKLKELVYVHAEGIPAGELKHGPLALLDENSIVVVLNPEDETYGDTLSNVHEIRSRGAKIVGVSNARSNNYDKLIRIPKASPILYPMIEVIPLQLLAYHTAIKRESNPDYPRNLAKSVTVK